MMQNKVSLGPEETKKHDMSWLVLATEPGTLGGGGVFAPTIETFLKIKKIDRSPWGRSSSSSWTGWWCVAVAASPSRSQPVIVDHEREVIKATVSPDQRPGEKPSKQMLRKIHRSKNPTSKKNYQTCPNKYSSLDSEFLGVTQEFWRNFEPLKPYQTFSM